MLMAGAGAIIKKVMLSRDLARALSWPRADGEITKSKITMKDSQAGMNSANKTFKAEITYKYTAGKKVIETTGSASAVSCNCRYAAKRKTTANSIQSGKPSPCFTTPTTPPTPAWKEKKKPLECTCSSVPSSRSSASLLSAGNKRLALPPSRLSEKPLLNLLRLSRLGFPAVV